MNAVTTQQELDFDRIARAIEFIDTNFKSQPTLDEVAAAVNLSPFHFQKIFSDWAGTSPKKFLQYTSINYAKSLIRDQQATLFDVAIQTGLSTSSRLHDLFIKIEGMTPGEYKTGGAGLRIRYSFASTLFGDVLVASTYKGVCKLAFSESKEQSILDLNTLFPKATFVEQEDEFQTSALSIFSGDWRNISQVKLHLKGTNFQLRVWEMLLKIPAGKLSTYGTIAGQINTPSASRAVGTAIGDNPVAFLIPCHRVIQASGAPGGYRWGLSRKKAMIGWEASRLESNMANENVV